MGSRLCREAGKFDASSRSNETICANCRERFLSLCKAKVARAVTIIVSGCDGLVCRREETISGQAK